MTGRARGRHQNKLLVQTTNNKFDNKVHWKQESRKWYKIGTQRGAKNMNKCSQFETTKILDELLMY